MIEVRSPSLDFDDTIPLDWLGGNLALTHCFNAAGVLIPQTERFFIRSVRRLDGHARDEQHSAEILAFYAQEAQHGAQHHRADAVLVEQGFDLAAPLRRYSRGLTALEMRLSPKLALSVTAGMEHLFSCLGDFVIRDAVMVEAHPTMRDLWEWHGVEEIEHKAVAFDLYREIGAPWWHRTLGLVIGGLLLFVGWLVILRALRAQDPASTPQRTRRDRDAWLEAGQPKLWTLLLRYAWPYLRRHFHPDQHDQRALVAATLSRLATSA